MTTLTAALTAAVARLARLAPAGEVLPGEHFAAICASAQAEVDALSTAVWEAEQAEYEERCASARHALAAADWHAAQERAQRMLDNARAAEWARDCARMR